MTTKRSASTPYSSRMRTDDRSARDLFARTLLPTLSADHLGDALGRLHDRSRGDAEQHLLETLKLLVLTELCGLPVDTSGELETARTALADSPQAYADLRESMHRGGCPRGIGERCSTHEAHPELIRCVAAYVCTFGPFTPRTVRLWPDAQAVMAELRVGVSGLNDLAASWREPGGDSSTSPWRALGAVSRISELAGDAGGEPRVQGQSGRMRVAAPVSARRTARIDGAAADTRLAAEKISRRGAAGSAVRSTDGVSPAQTSSGSRPTARPAWISLT